MAKILFSLFFLVCTVGFASSVHAQTDPAADASLVTADTELGTIDTELGTANTALGAIETATQSTSAALNGPTPVASLISGVDGGAATIVTEEVAKFPTGLAGESLNSSQATELDTAATGAMTTDEEGGLLTGSPYGNQQARFNKTLRNVEGEALGGFTSFSASYDKASALDDVLGTQLTAKAAITVNGKIAMLQLQNDILLGRAIEVNTVATIEAREEQVEEGFILVKDRQQAALAVAVAP